MTLLEFTEEVALFLQEWESPEPEVEVHTSGSTGVPKAMRVAKSRMRASARATCRFLGLKRGDSALLCMSVRYIAGKMMVVRARECGLILTLTPPSSHPLKGFEERQFDFVAMTPMQVYDTLQVPAEAEALRRVRHLLIGGGAIDARLAEALREFPHAVWSSYGMTETLSHIALRRLSGPEATEWYTPLSGVDVRLADDGALCITAPQVCPTPLHTHDLATLNARGEFRILGRTDNVINSGGIKIQMEEVEARLLSVLPDAFQVTRVADAKFGEAVALLTLNPSPSAVLTLCQRHLPPYWVPKHVWSVDALPLTGTGKPDRATAQALAAKMLAKQRSKEGLSLKESENLSPTSKDNPK
jgi:O-succinylbenzoic acid--CoA ligase